MVVVFIPNNLCGWFEVREGVKRDVWSGSFWTDLFVWGFSFWNWVAVDRDCSLSFGGLDVVNNHCIGIAALWWVVGEVHVAVVDGGVVISMTNCGYWQSVVVSWTSWQPDWLLFADQNASP